jgi:tetratricopeptide (TPR) repeat protein
LFVFCLDTPRYRGIYYQKFIPYKHMMTPQSHIATRPLVSAKKLIKLERAGRYEDALAMIRHIWPDLSAVPDIIDLAPRDAAEMLLRCGSLLGFLGHAKQLRNSQERAKNLLTEARTRFLDIYDIEKIAECENHLALTYWRAGELNEASAWIDEALSHGLPGSNAAHLYCRVTRLLINLEAGRFAENVAMFAELDPLFRTHGDAFLCGCFYANIGISHQELGNLADAIEYLELAEGYHVRSRNKIYLGSAGNNLAMLYKKTGEFEKAHAAIDSAIKLFRQIKDRTREGFTIDTKAQIYFAEAQYADALKTSEKAISFLEKGENSAFVVEAVMTKVKTLVFTGDISGAALDLVKAVNIARAQTGEESAKILTNRFEAAIRERPLPVPPAVPYAPELPAARDDLVRGDGLRLVLPPSISHYTDYQGVWINGTHLEKAGLTQGSLAVVVHEEVKRGDLVAIAEIGSDMVICGYYDADFGMISLEGDDAALQMFDEHEVKVLGRIVGVCNTGTGPDGKMIVEPVNV